MQPVPSAKKADGIRRSPAVSTAQKAQNRPKLAAPVKNVTIIGGDTGRLARRFLWLFCRGPEMAAVGRRYLDQPNRVAERSDNRDRQAGIFQRINAAFRIDVLLPYWNVWQNGNYRDFF